MQTRIRKRQEEGVNAAPALRDRVEALLSSAVNASPSSHYDPLYAVAETFQQSFQRIGRARTGAEETQTAENKSQEEETPETSEQNATPMQKFSEMAFERGELSAAILQGTGKLALISCLKRAAGQPEQSVTLFGLGAQTRNVPARDPNQVMFHRNFAASAVGLVVDTLRDARLTVDSLTDMATGVDGFRAEDGGLTLRTMYPFLDDSRERALLAERRERLKGDCTPDERAILENAAIRAGALIAKKARMKEEFVQKLREVSERATEALAELEAPETLQEATQALTEPETDTPSLLSRLLHMLLSDVGMPPPPGSAEAETTPDTADADSPEASEDVPDATDAESAEPSEDTPDATDTENAELSGDTPGTADAESTGTGDVPVSAE